MRQSTKGAILSAVVYPGLGQLVLGAILSGAFFVLFTTAGFLVLIYRLTIRIYQSIDQILPLLAKNARNFDQLVEIISTSSYDSWRIEGISLVIILCCWAGSTVHAFVSGRKVDRREMADDSNTSESG